MSSLPKGWIEGKLEQIVSLRREKAKPISLVDLPFIGLEDIESHTSKILRTRSTAVVKSTVARFFKGDVLYSRLRPYLNKVFSASFDGTASAEFLVLRPNEATVAEFVRRRIMAKDFLDFAAVLDKGDRPRVNFDEISTFSIALPPPEEQKRIVAKIDSLTNRTARAQRELLCIPSLISSYKQSILASAFSGELTRDWNKKQKRIEPYIFRNTGSHRRKTLNYWAWEKHKVEDVAYVALGRQRSPKDHVGPNMRPYLRSANITWKGLDLSDVKQMNFSDREFEIYKLLPGDILLNEGSGSAKEVGKPAIWYGKIQDCCFQNTLLRVRTKKKLVKTDFAFLYFYHCALSGAFISNTRGVNIQHIGREGLAQFDFPLPNLEEQAEIVRRITLSFKKLNRLTVEYSRIASLLPKLNEAILAKAFRGELLPQTPNDEPASVLLDRLRVELNSEPKQKLLQRKIAAKKGDKDPSNMDKTRKDVSADHLISLVKKAGGKQKTESLWRMSEMEIGEFYKQLRSDVANGQLAESEDKGSIFNAH